MKKLWGAVLAVAFAPLALIGPGPRAGAAVDGTAVMDIERFGALIVDPDTGRVFVSGDDVVEVFDPSGQLERTIEDIPGAAGMSIEGGSLYVVAMTSDAVVEVDLATLTVAATLPTDVQLRDDIVVHGNVAWLLAEVGSDRSALRRLDLVDGDVFSRGLDNLLSVTRLEEIPGDDGHVLAFHPGVSVPDLMRIDVRPTPAVIETWVRQFRPGATDLAVTQDGSLMAAGTAHQAFQEVSASSLEPTGVKHGPTNAPGGPYPNGVAYAPARGGVFAGTTADPSNEVEIFRRGTPLTTHRFTQPEPVVPRSVGLGPAADRAYVLTRTDAAHLTLRTHDLAVTLDQVDPETVPVGSATDVHLHGRALASITSAQLEGSEVPYVRVSPTEVIVRVSPIAAESPQTLVLETDFGTISTDLAVASATEATLRGTVTENGEPVGGVQVVVYTEPVRQVSTEADGTYEMTGLQAQPNAQMWLSVRGRGLRPPNVDLLPGAVRTADIELSEPQEFHGSIRTQLPPGEFGDLVVAPDGTRLFVSTGDTVAVFDAGGTLLATIADQWTASGMHLVGGRLFVNLRDAGMISEIDTETLEVVRTYPAGRPTLGDVVATAEDLWVTNGDKDSRALARIDRASGDIEVYGCFGLDVHCYEERLSPLADATDGFVSSTSNLSSLYRKSWDTSTDPPTVIASADHDATEDPDVAASRALDRHWSPDGLERLLSTLAPTGVEYGVEATARAAAYRASTEVRSASIGLGSRIFRPGSEQATHDLPVEPVARGLAFNPAGGTAYAISDEHELVVLETDGPSVSGTTPYQPAWGTSFTLHGDGFGQVDQVLLDWQSALAFEEVGPRSLKVTLPVTTVGLHWIEVDTPSGHVWHRIEVVDPGPPTVEARPYEASATVPTTVQIHGENFVRVTDVRVAGSSVSFIPRSRSSLDAVIPPAPAGSEAPIVVETDFGTSSTDAAPTVTWFEPARFDSITPAVGTGGGVEIQGELLDRVYALTMDGKPLSFHHPDEHTLQVWLPAHAPGHVRIEGRTPTERVTVDYQFVDPDSSAKPTIIQPTAVGGTYQPLGGDFDGDGVDDVFWYAPGSTPDSIWRFTPDGRYSKVSQSVSGTFRPAVGDFTGDGVDDIFWYAPGTAADSIWDFNQGGTRTNRSVTQSGDLVPVVGDFTGDGVEDIFWYGPGSAADSLWDFNAGGNRTAKAFSVGGTGYRPVAGDLTGDGVDDIAWYAPGTTGDSIWDFDTGGSRTTRALAVSGTYLPVTGEFTGDDVDDVIWYAPGTAVDTLWDYDAGGTKASRPLSIPGSPRLAAADLTGGGVTDLVLHGPSTAPDALWFMSPLIR